MKYQKTVTVYETVPIENITGQGEKYEIAARVISEYVTYLREQLKEDANGLSWDEVLMSVESDVIDEMADQVEEAVYAEIGEKIGIGNASFFIHKLLIEGDLKPFCKAGLLVWISFQSRNSLQLFCEDVENLCYDVLDVVRGEKPDRFEVKNMADGLLAVVTNMGLQLKNRSREVARSAAIARYKEDPKQAAAAKVKECWSELTLGQKKRGYKADFARKMLGKFPELTSQKVIEDWCRTWEKQCMST
ncbi:MAG: hypothetical protein BWK73_36045 [Thiothrix lacustris]|uniref:Uncharacterized protein n=1 Tax=Thiothrix lacustris TaxID=525917 RepID=A0A1Y1QG69_9GAMM|nr:MAG: hypothetical protein BWK73_36045 [Thiothrix lacustris]